MAKLTLGTFASDYQSTSLLNSNSVAIEAALENTLSRDGTSPNQMAADFDMNSHRILNLPTPVLSPDVVRLGDVPGLVAQAIQGQTVGSIATGVFSTTTALLSAYGSAVTLADGFPAQTVARSTAGDKGGGLFFYRATDTTSSDNGGTIRVDGQNRRWYLQSPIVTAQMFGAVGDGTTNDTAAFTAIEASTVSAIYLPEGYKYKTTLTSLQKRYFGSGTVLLANGSGRPGLRSTELTVDNRFSDLLRSPQTTSKSLVILGDSNEDQFGVTYGQGWTSLIQNLMSQTSGISTTSFLSTSCLNHLTQTGGWIGDASGPLGQGLQGPVGATLSWVADDVDYVRLYFRRAAGLGSVNLSYTDDVGTTSVGTISTAGATADMIAVDFTGTPLRLGKNVIFTLTVSVNSVALNGLVCSNASQPASTVFPIVLAFSGYTTANFADAARLPSISNFDPYGNDAVYILPGLTNDIYNATFYRTVAQSKANLETIIGTVGNCWLRINARPNETTLGYSSRTGEGYDAYRTMIYNLAEKYSLPVLDLGEIDLASSTGVYQDGLHYTALGHRLVASYIAKKMGLLALPFKPIRSSISLLAGAAVVSGFTTPESVVKKNGRVSLKGLLNITGIAQGTTIGTVSAEARPVKKACLTSHTRSPFGPASIEVQPSGALILQYYSATTPTYVSLDGLGYDVF